MQKVLRVLPLLYLVVVAIASALLGYSDNPLKVATVVAFVLLWIGIFLIKGSFIASVILLILTFPFTLSFQVEFLEELGFVNGLYVNYLIPTIYLLDVFVIALLLSTFSFINRSMISKKVVLSFTVLVSFWLIQDLLHLDLGVAISSTRYLLYILMFFGVYLCRDKLLDFFYKYKNLMVGIVIFSLFFQLIVAMIQVYSGSNVGIEWLGESLVSAGNVNASTLELEGRLFLRGYGTFSHPNILAGYSTLILIIFLTLFKPFLLIRKRLLIFISILAFLVTLISISHGGFIVYLAVIISYALYLVYLRFYKEKKSLKLNHLPSVIILMDRSVNERIELIRSSWEYFIDNVFIGVGSGNFLKDFYLYAPRSDDGFTLMQPVHNIFILIMVEYGIIGGLAVNIFLAMFFVYRFLVSRYKIVVFLVAIYLIIIGSVDHYLITLPQGFFLLLSGLFYISITD